MAKLKKIGCIVFGIIFLIMLSACSSSVKEDDVQETEIVVEDTQELEQQDGTITLSQLLKTKDLVIFYVWDENMYSVGEFDEFAKVDSTSKTLVFDEEGVYVLHSISEFNDFDDMRLGELLEVSDESIENAVKNGDEPCREYKLLGYTDEQGEMYQELLLTIEDYGEEGKGGYPFYFENSFSKELNGENYIGFYMADDRGMQVCLIRCEDDVTLVFDKEKDLIMNVSPEKALRD